MPPVPPWAWVVIGVFMVLMGLLSVLAAIRAIPRERGERGERIIRQRTRLQIAHELTMGAIVMSIGVSVLAPQEPLHGLALALAAMLSLVLFIVR